MNIIFEDQSLLVIDKPPGLVVDESLGQKLGGFPAHRLDKDTSGLLLVAKNQKALENLQSQFKSRAVKKEYLALVHGEILEGGVVDAAIIRNPGNREKFTTVPPGRSQSPPSRWPNGLLEGERSGRGARTEYQPEQNFQFSILNLQSIFNDLNKIQMRKLEKLYQDGFTLVRCFPKTGRTHQIRVHLKYIGHPVVADEKYVGRKIYRLDCRWCPRQFLHAAKIGFKHSRTGKWMELESKLPQDLRGALSLLSSRT